MGLFDNWFTSTTTAVATESAISLQGDDAQKFNSALSLPGSPTADDVTTTARKAGEMEASNELLKLQSEQLLSVQQQALTAMDIRINHAAASMKNAEQMKKKINRHGKNIINHALHNTVEQAQMDGYQQLTAQSQSLIKF